MIPPIANVRIEDGRFKDGVFVFRTLDDCHRIMRCAAKRAARGGHRRRIARPRGGPRAPELGLETHVVHLMPHLMEAQLDAAAGARAAAAVRAHGARRRTSKRARPRVLGNGHVQGLEFADGSRLDCDLVVIAAGIRPNVELAVDAGLNVGRGIVVGDDLVLLRTMRPRPTSMRSANVRSIAARCTGWSRRCGNRPRCSPIGSAAAIPTPSIPARKVSTKLKVMGVDLAVMGEKEPVEEDDEVVSYSEPSRGIYKKLIVRNDRLVGAIVIGDGAIVPSLLQTFAAASY